MEVWNTFASLKGLGGNDVLNHRGSSSDFLLGFIRVGNQPSAVGYVYGLLDTTTSDMQCQIQAKFEVQEWATPSKGWYRLINLALDCNDPKDGTINAYAALDVPSVVVGIPNPEDRQLKYKEVERLLQTWLEYVVRRETDLPFDFASSPGYFQHFSSIMEVPPLLYKGAKVFSVKGVGHPDFQRHVVVEYKQLSASGKTVGEVVHLLVEREQIDTITKKLICNGSHGSCFFGHGDEYHFCSGKNEELVSAVRERNQRDAAMDWRKRLPLLSGEQQWSGSIGSQGMFGRIGSSHADAAQEAARKREWIKAGGRR